MQSTGNDRQIIVTHRIHQPIRLIDSPRPKPTQIFRQRLRLPNPLKRFPQRRLNQFINTFILYLVQV
jgi:hypothetical protein